MLATTSTTSTNSSAHMTIRIRTPTSSETYECAVPAGVASVSQLRAHLTAAAAAHAASSPIAAFVHEHAASGRFVFRGRFCADEDESLASVGLDEGAVLHLIQRGRALGNSLSDPNLSPRPSRLSRSHMSDVAHDVAAAAPAAAAAAVASTTQNMTLSVNGVQFTVPVQSSGSGGPPTTVQVRMPVQLQRAPMLSHSSSGTTTIEASSSSTSLVGGDPHSPTTSRSSSQSSIASATLSPTASREALVANNLSSQLLHAVRSGDVAEVRELLANGANASMLHGTVTPFHVAALQPEPTLVELLLAQPGVNTELKNRNGETALHYASFHRNARVQKALLQARANVHARTSAGDTALHLAASVGATGEVLEQLLTRMSACPFNPRHVCVLRTALAVALDDSFGRSVLARAVIKGSVATVHELLALVPKPGSACACGGAECVPAARAVWQQMLLVSDAFGRVCDANLLLAAARHGDAPDSVFALTLRAWWHAVCDRLSHDAARALLARYLTMLSREQSVCSLLKLDTDTIFERFVGESQTQ